MPTSRALLMDIRRTEEKAAVAVTLWTSAVGPGQRDGPRRPGVRHRTKRLVATPAVASCGGTAGAADVCSWQTMTCGTRLRVCRPPSRLSRSGPTPTPARARGRGERRDPPPVFVDVPLVGRAYCRALRSAIQDDT